MKKKEIMTKATQVLSKTAFKLKKASPTIMVIGAAIGGVTATVLACKATLKAQDILAEHKSGVEKIHEAKDKVDSGEIKLSEGETYTEKDMKDDITKQYLKTGLKLAKVYAPAVGLGAASLGCMFGSHHIMTKRNATLTAAYIALEQTFNSYKNRVTDRFGERVQHELEQNIKAVEVETKKVDENGVEEVIKEYRDIAEQADDPCSLIFDETVDTWQRDADLNRNYLLLMESAANKRLRTQGHLFLNEVLSMIGTHGGQSLRTPAGQIIAGSMTRTAPLCTTVWISASPIMRRTTRL
jgi:hypothetical protein